MKWIVIYDELEEDGIDDFSEYVGPYLENADDIAVSVSILVSNNDYLETVLDNIRTALQP
jgi:hypothetical protein